jgi:hypothetical protein
LGGKSKTFKANQFPKTGLSCRLLFMKFKISILLSAILSLTQIFIAFAQVESISSLKFLGGYEVPNRKLYKNTTVGGLSGIDYDPINGLYYIISDDRSGINSVRYYTAKLFLSENGVDSVQFIAVQYLLQANGNVYPNSKTDPEHAPDPEAIRYNVKTGELVWTSEGERTKKQYHFVLQNPTVNVSRLDGRYLSSFPTATNAFMYVTELGSRQNGALEGLTFSQDYTSLFASMEEPLYQDGPRADVIRNNAWIRIYKYDVASKQNVAQYAYELEPVAFSPFPPTAFKVNGISEILFLNDHKLLTIERSFSTGRLACSVKVFEADLSKADNIITVASLKENPSANLVKKKLLLNMDTLGTYIDNVEGVTFGPRLANNHQTLVFVSDNNFSSTQKTQFLLFEVIP